MKFMFPCVALLVGTASAQFSLPANPASNNQGSINWGLFFDLTAGPGGVTVTGLTTASDALPMNAVDLEIYVIDGTCLTGVGGSVGMGPGSSMTGWNLLGTASGTQSATSEISDPITIPSIVVPGGETVGVCLRFTSADPLYFGMGNTDPYQTFSDGLLTITAGDARSQIFTPTGSFFAPRALVGEIFYSAGGSALGEEFCGPGALNSSGLDGQLLAQGSAAVSDNDIVLEASQLPPDSFGFFITSQIETFVMNPGGSAGNLCLGGSIGRYVGPGEIQSSGASGTISLAIDLTQVPQPTGTVAVAPGDIWSFQLWHRDTVGGMSTSNFTDGLRITFN